MNDQLIRLFQQSISSDPAHRKRAEDELEQLKDRTGFLAACFHLAIAEPVEMATRQSAIIFFKNSIKRTWESRSDAEKLQIRNLIIEPLGSLPQTLRTQVVYVLGFILTMDDKPENWPGFADIVLRLLMTGNLQSILSATLALQEYAKISQWRTGKTEDVYFARFSREALPVLLEFSSTFVRNPAHFNADLTTLFLIKTVLKTFRNSTQFSLPRELQDLNVLENWIGFMIELSKSANVVASKNQLPRDCLEMWLKIQKWAIHSINHIWSRYGNSNADAHRNPYKKFAREFITRFATKMVQYGLQEAETFVNQKTLSPRSLFTLVNFLGDSVKSKMAWEVLKPFVPQIFDVFIFPLLCMNEQDEELWESEPVEFIQRQTDPLEHFLQPSSAASNFVLTLYSERPKECEQMILEKLGAKLNNPQTPNEKDGALNVLAILSKKLLSGKNNSVMSSIPMIIQNFVLPELHSAVPYLQWRACSVLDSFCAYDSKDKLQLFPQHTDGWTQIYNQLVLMLQSSEHLPVRVAAAKALEQLIERPEVKLAVEQSVGPLMESFLKLTNEIDLDTVASAMERLVELYPDQIMPFASQLVQQLVLSSIRILEEIKDIDEMESSDKVLTVMGMMSTLSTIVTSMPEAGDSDEEDLNAALAFKALGVEIEAHCTPLLGYILNNNVIDLYEECFQLLDSLVSVRCEISESVWTFFPKLCEIIQEDVIDYAEEVVPLLFNYISYAPRIVASNADIYNTLVQTVHSLLDSNLPANEKVLAFGLMEMLMLHCRGMIDNLVFILLNMAVGAEKEAVSNIFRSWYVLTLTNGFYYNPAMMTEILRKHGKLDWALNMMLQMTPKLKRVHDCKLSVLASLAMLYQADILQFTPEQIKLLVSLQTEHIKQLPAAEKSRAEIKERYGDEDDFDDFSIKDEVEEHFEAEESEYYNSSEDESTEKEGNWTEFDRYEEADQDIEDDSFDETPLDNLNIREVYKASMMDIQTQKPAIFASLIQFVTPADAKAVSAIVSGQEFA